MIKIIDESGFPNMVNPSSIKKIFEHTDGSMIVETKTTKIKTNITFETLLPRLSNNITEIINDVKTTITIAESFDIIVMDTHRDILSYTIQNKMDLDENKKALEDILNSDQWHNKSIDVIYDASIYPCDQKHIKYPAKLVLEITIKEIDNYYENILIGFIGSVVGNDWGWGGNNKGKSYGITPKRLWVDTYDLDAIVNHGLEDIYTTRSSFTVEDGSGYDYYHCIPENRLHHKELVEYREDFRLDLSMDSARECANIGKDAAIESADIGAKSRIEAAAIIACAISEAGDKQSNATMKAAGLPAHRRNTD